MGTQTTLTVAEIAAQGLTLYYQGDKAAAFPLLAQVAEVDGHALLCFGWLQVELAEATQNSNLLKRGLENIALALKRWAYNPSYREWQAYKHYQSSPLKTDEQYWQDQLNLIAQAGYYHILDEINQFAASNNYFDD